MFDFDKDLKKWIEFVGSDTPISNDDRKKLKEFLEHELQMKLVHRRYAYNRSHGPAGGY